MNPELKTKWTDALRSGRYSQGQEVLRSVDDKFCCLGVAADIIDPTGWGPGGPQDGDCYVWCDSIGNLPYSTLSVLGIDSEIMTDLIGMNDDDGATFGDIAAWIEKNL